MGLDAYRTQAGVGGFDPLLPIPQPPPHSILEKHPVPNSISTNSICLGNKQSISIPDLR